MTDKSTDYELVLETQSAGDLAFLKSILDAEGVTYFVLGEHVAQFIFHSVPMRLMVKKEDVSKTKEILKGVNLSSAYSGFKRYKS